MNYSSQDSPSLARGTQEGRSRFVPKFKKRARFPSSTPPGSETSSSPSSLHNPFSYPFTLSQPILLTSRKSIHTRAQGRTSLFPVSRNAKRVRWGASRRRVPTEAVVFPSGSTVSRRGSGASVGPHPVVLPLPLFQQSTPTGANSKPRGAQSSTGRRSHHFPRVRIHLSMELLSRIFFCGCLESCCSFFLFLFRVTFSINQRGRDGRRNNSRGREFYS